MGFGAGFLGTCFFIFSIWTGTESNQTTRFWTVIGFSLVVGLTAGFFLPSLTRLGLAVSGGALGFFISMLIYSLFLVKLKSEPAQLLFYNLVGIGAIIGIIFGYEFHQ
jgi:hypothetical protein